MVQIQVPRAELLEAMKGCLHDLEELKLLNPDDLDIIDERRILRQKIAELEGKADQDKKTVTGDISDYTHDPAKKVIAILPTVGAFSGKYC